MTTASCLYTVNRESDHMYMLILPGFSACRNITPCRSSMLLLRPTAAQVSLVCRRVPVDAALTAGRLQPRSSVPTLHLFHQRPVHAHILVDNIP